ncbi:hypothetical protein PAMP_003704 [Pampus punctatissimus]
MVYQCRPILGAIVMHRPVDVIHGLGQGWVGSGDMGEVAKNPDKRERKADFRFVHLTGTVSL